MSCQPLSFNQPREVTLDPTRGESARGLRTCLHRLFESSAAKLPNEIAVVHGGEQLSYAELNARANQLANLLRTRGVGRSHRVGICLPRSLDFAVAILAVLKTGGTVVPLDPKYPSDRLTYMLSDVAAPLVITEPGLLDANVPSGTEVMFLSEQRNNLAGEPRSDFPNESHPGDIAYIIYTSGSTGRPRGVLLHHAGLANYAASAAEMFALGRGDRMLQFCSISFDAALEEIYATWAAGATLVFRMDDLSLEPSEFLGWVGRQGVTAMDLPTAYWHEWVYAMPALEEKVPASVRLVIVGGEKASPQAYATWHKFAGNRVRWINTYGPAEASIVATAYEPGLQWSEDSPAVLPIGRPVADARVYLLDENLRAVPPGVAGELHIAGIGVAAGYLNQPELTAERFVRDVFDDDPSARMYRTGDMARSLASGDLEFVGRRDNQVKIRGFRVELGEIENVLLSHTGVKDAAVILHEHEGSKKRLVAYTVRSERSDVSDGELRKLVQSRLPEYMSPAEFVFIEALPLTPNGKVDRRALAALKRESPSTISISCSGIDDPLQLQLLRIWEEVLERSPIGLDDNFFDLGGHSLLAARMMLRVKQLNGKNLPLAVLLQAPTIAKLSGLLRDGQELHWSSLVPIQPEGSKPPFFMVHGVGGNVVGFQQLGRHMRPDYPFYGLQSQALSGKHSFQVTVEEMAEHYLKEIRTVQPSGPYHLGGFSMGGLVAYEMALQLRRRGEEVALLVMFDTYATAPKSANQGLIDLLLHPSWKQFASLPLAFRKKIRRTLLMRRLAEDLKQVMRSNARAADTYRLQPYSGHAILLRAGRSWRVSDDPYAAWTRLVGELESIEIPGEHMDILREPHVSRLAERLKGCIDGAAFGYGELLASQA